MTDGTTVIIHDWENSVAAEELARSLADNPDTKGLRKAAVVGRDSTQAAGEVLTPLGFEILGIENGASAGARKNRGLKDATGDVVLLSAGVKLPDPGWLRVMLEEAGATGRGVVGLKVIDESGLIDNCGYQMTLPEYEMFHIGGVRKDINQYYYGRTVEGIDSRCMYVSRSAFEAAAGFDEGFGAGYEDADFCLKVKLAGMPVTCVGSSRVVASEQKDQGQVDRYRDEYRKRWERYYRERYETRVMWHSWINAPTGYAVSSQYLVLALEALDVDVRYGYVYGVEEPPNDDGRIMEVRKKPKDLDVTQVVYGQGDVFFKNSGRYKVGYSMLEVDGIPRNWVEQANAMDEVWVPSHFNRETFAASGVKRPIVVMPLGVDIDYFNPHIRSRRPDDRYVFLSVFEWGERKAPEVLLKAYNQEFSNRDDVLLLLKVTNTDPALNIERQVQAMRLEPDRAPVVMVLNQSVPSYQMGALYCSSDCFVLPTRGEGWGMPTLEAMACGLPVISTSWSAQTEFFSEEVGYPIEMKRLIPAVAKCPYYEGFSWADPDVDHLSHLMRHVYENQAEARATGLKASIQAREKWTWMEAAGRIKKRLLEITS
jgi:hypothetical protein